MSIKNSKLGDSVASEMFKILEDPTNEYMKAFAKPELNREIEAQINQNPSYKAFTRLASDSSSSTKTPTDVGEVMNIDDILGPSANVLAATQGGKVKKADAGLAIEYMVNSLIQTSAALDNLGLLKSSSIALGLLDTIIREASIIALGQEAVEQMEGRVNEMSPADIINTPEMTITNKMEPGMVYLLDGSSDWQGSSDDSWQNEMYNPTGEETYVGDRKIDDSDVSVFRGPDGKFYAELIQNVGDTNSVEPGVEAHKDDVTTSVTETQKTPGTRHEPPAQSLPLMNQTHHGHLDTGRADDTDSHRDEVTTTVTDTQKTPETRHESPAQSLSPNHPKERLVDYNKVDTEKEIFRTTTPIKPITEPEEKNPLPLEPSKKDLVQAMEELEAWIKAS